MWDEQRVCWFLEAWTRYLHVENHNTQPKYGLQMCPCLNKGVRTLHMPYMYLKSLYVQCSSHPPLVCPSLAAFSITKYCKQVFFYFLSSHHPGSHLFFALSVKFPPIFFPGSRPFKSCYSNLGRKKKRYGEKMRCAIYGMKRNHVLKGNDALA